MKPVWDEKEKRSNFKDILLDVGEYPAKIKKAEWTTSDYMKNEYNKTGACLSVWVDIEYDGENKRIFDRISVTNPTKLNELRKSAGFKPVKKGENFDGKPLVGKQVYVEVDGYTAKSTGKVSNIVKKYLEDIEDSQNNDEEISEYNDDYDSRIPF